MLTAKDVNSNITTYQYTDSEYWRVGGVIFPDSPSDTETFTYATGTTTPWTITTTKTTDSTQNLGTINYLDGFGRTYAVYLTDPDSTNGGYRHVWTWYDSVGRVSAVSNPYYSNTDSTYGTTSFTYDALSRVTQVTNPDSSYRTISYSGRAQQVIDEAQITKVYQNDGLGRLKYVCDGIGASQQANSTNPSSCGLDVSASGFLSTYGYDALGNITSASVGACTGCTTQTRSYSYDGLSRLLTEKNPEIAYISCGGGSYSVCYAYDTGSAGDLYTKTFPKPSGGTVTATYTWDNLHRPTGTTFNDSSPSYTYAYDASTEWGNTLSNPKGRMVLQNHGNFAESIYSYDAMGRIINTWACTPDICGTSNKELTYTYNFLGEPATLLDASGTTFTYSYNRIGELTGITSSLANSTHPGTLFSGGTYNPFGKLTQGTYGDGIIRNNSYDKMGRLTEIQDGSTSSPTYRLYLTYFGNSSVKTYNDTVGGSWTYTYDAFNRLATSSNGDTGDAYSYSYDQFGNRWQQTVTGGTGWPASYTFNNNNQITNAGFSYDAAGNVTSNGSCSPCWVYDDLGNLTGGGNATFAYDALGQRVQKVYSGTTYDFLLGLDGHPFDEYQGTTRSRVTGGLFTYANNTTYFNRTDHLGTPRASTDYTGTVQRTENDVAFGDGFTESYSGLDFTGFANGFWDAENNADHFGAREYAKAQGRWLSPDPAGLAAVNPMNPQTWNRYAYVANNPVSFVDPLGLLLEGPHNSNCQPTANGWSYTCGGCPMNTLCVGGGGGGGGIPDITGYVFGYWENDTWNTTNIILYGQGQEGGQQIDDPSNVFGGWTNQGPKPWKVHGNWCGPNWTGGKAGEYDPAIDKAGGYSPPQDALDTACMQHDMCYYQCRQEYPCDPAGRSQCFATACDGPLGGAAHSLPASWDSTRIDILMNLRATDLPPFRPNPYPNQAGCQQ